MGFWKKEKKIIERGKYNLVIFNYEACGDGSDDDCRISFKFLRT